MIKVIKHLHNSTFILSEVGEQPYLAHVTSTYIFINNMITKGGAVCPFLKKAIKEALTLFSLEFRELGQLRSPGRFFQTTGIQASHLRHKLNSNLTVQVKLNPVVMM